MAAAKRKAAKRPTKRLKAAPVDPVTAYARDVVAQRVVTGKLVRLACERHLRDRKLGRGRGLVFDAEAAQFAIDFFGFLAHWKGEWAGQPLTLEPWQQFIIGCLFGWKVKQTGMRRFRIAYVEVARKNGKSTTAGGLGDFLLVADGEEGAEIYCAATKKDQAKIVFNDAKSMVKASPTLRKHVQVYVGNMSVAATNSKFEPLGADEDTMDGLNVHAAIIDELHAHKNSGIVDKLKTATGSRRQPLIFEITTAGYDRTSICWAHHEYTQKVVEGVIEDDSWFGLVYALDEEDDWTDPAVWVKANPNLGVSKKLATMEHECLQAQHMPAAQNGFKRLHLNIWTEQSERWFTIEAWDACTDGSSIADLRATLRGRRAYGGLDLSSTTDLSAWVLLFPPLVPDERWKVLCRFWVPKDTIQKRSKEDGVPYDQWVAAGLIEATPGNITDYDVIRRRIGEDSEEFDIRQEKRKDDDIVPEIAYDRWNATQLVTQLAGDGFTMVPFGQGFGSMASPSAEIEKLIVGAKLEHGGHPVLRWMASNVAAHQDAAGNRKPDKSKSTERIDGVVALVMALGRAMVQPVETASVYDTRGLLEL